MPNQEFFLSDKDPLIEMRGGVPKLSFYLSDCDDQVEVLQQFVDEFNRTKYETGIFVEGPLSKALDFTIDCDHVGFPRKDDDGFVRIEESQRAKYEAIKAALHECLGKLERLRFVDGG